MRFQVVGNKADVAFVVVKNSTANTIPGGTPVFLTLNGTDDGLAVQDANAAGAVLNGTCMGLLTNALAANTQGEAQAYGINASARLVTGTRAASTNAFNSCAAVALGDVMIPVTISGAGGLTVQGAGATGTVLPYFVAAQTLAAVASSVGTTATGLVRTAAVKVFIRTL